MWGVIKLIAAPVSGQQHPALLCCTVTRCGKGKDTAGKMDRDWYSVCLLFTVHWSSEPEHLPAPHKTVAVSQAFDGCCMPSVRTIRVNQSDGRRVDTHGDWLIVKRRLYSSRPQQPNTRPKDKARRRCRLPKRSYRQRGGVVTEQYSETLDTSGRKIDSNLLAVMSQSPSPGQTRAGRVERQFYSDAGNWRSKHTSVQRGILRRE